MTDTLPVHPFSGVRAIGVVAGRPVFPILGADARGDEQTFARLTEIDTRIEAIRSEMLPFAERDNIEEGSEDATRFDALETEFDTLSTEREPLARRAATIERVRSAVRGGRGGRTDGPDVHVRNGGDPFEGLDAVRGGSLAVSDLRSRALTAIEQTPDYLLNDDQRARAEGLLRHGDRNGRIARHMLLTGSDAYLRAFEAVLSGLQPWQLEGDEAEAMRYADGHRRAVVEGTNTAGGFLVPFMLDPTIILTNAGSTNPLRQICTVKSITTNAWHGVTSAGVTAEWLAEQAEVADHSPAFTQPAIPVEKAGSYIQATFEATQDTNIASEVGMLLADAKDTFEAVAFVSGDGSAKPNGIAHALAAKSASLVDTATTDVYAVADVYSVAGAVPPRFRKNAKWLGEYNTYLKTRQFASGTGPQHAFWADLGMDTPAELLGKPVYEASGMDNTLAVGTLPLIVGDFAAAYYIIDRIGMTMQFEPLVKGANRRPTGEVGWFATWRVGGDLVNPNALRGLRIKA